MGIDYTTNDVKYILSTLAAILNDKKPVSSFNRVNWNTIFRLANYHKIANIIYYAVLGSDEKMTEDVKKGFYATFNEALISYDRISKAQEALFWKLDMENITAVVFRMANFNDLYPLKEMGIPDALELYVLNENKEKMDEIMRSLDFLPSSIKYGDCIVYSRNPKCEIKVYFNNPFYDPVMKKYYESVFPKLAYMSDYKSIKGFDIDHYYLFLVSMAANNYALKTIKIRQMLDLWMYYRKYHEDFDWEYVQQNLEQLGIQELSNRILELCFIWFDGATAENSNELNIYDDMESYILSKGEMAFQENCEYFPLVYNLNRILIMEQEKAEKERYKKFLYPDSEYMRSLYPKLAKNKFGLMLAYFLRRMRLLGSKKEVEETEEAAREFYEPQSEYPDSYFDTEEMDSEFVKTAPLMVADDVKIMDDVLPVNVDNINVDKAAGKLGGFHSEEERMKESEKK